MRDREYDVIVVGAGFAGATVARECATRGLRVLVVEGRDQVGGRTCTSRLADGELVELGGTFVHWFQPHTWSEMTRYGLVDDVVQGCETPQWALSPHEDGLGWASIEEQFKREKGLMELFFERSYEELPRPYQPDFAGEAVLAASRKTVAQRLAELDVTAGDRALLEAFFTSHTCAPSDEGSYLSEMRWWAPAGHTYAGMAEASFGYKLRNGTVSLISAMLADGGATLRLEAPVRAITHDADGATVTLDDGERIGARAVVLAVPTGAWQDLDVSPALDPARVAASREGMQAASLSKGYLVLRGESRSVSLLPAQPHPITMLMTSHRRSDEEQLAVFWGTDLLGDPNDLERLNEAVQDLLPGVEVVEVAARRYHVEDRFTRGGWGVLKPGQLERYAPHVRFTRPEGRLFFASSDIATGWQGYIDGAIESGLHSARQVMEAIG